jgi:hypothetical protein
MIIEKFPREPKYIKPKAVNKLLQEPTLLPKVQVKSGDFPYIALFY